MKKSELKQIIKEVINEANEKEYSWKILIKSDKGVRDQFEKDLNSLFKKYESKTSDGYVKALYL